MNASEELKRVQLEKYEHNQDKEEINENSTNVKRSINNGI